MPDKTLTCRECGQQFVFTQGEQDFYAQRGYTNEPGRCPDCRAARKAQRSSEGGGGGYGREMFPAVCSACGRETQVPFRPTSGKPVYCSDCFAERGGGRSSGGSRGGGGYRGGGGL
jgi:CxxC-x17-CxxC domain-containing protein